MRALLLMSAALLVACGPRGPTAAEIAATRQAREAAELARQYDAAIAREDFTLAQILGNLVLTRHPSSAEAGRIRSQFETVQTRAAAQRDHKRQADLWTYHAVPMANGKGTVYTGFIWAQAEAGSSLPAVRLVLRNHPEWGLSAYLLSESGSRGSQANPPPPVAPANAATTGAVDPYRCEQPACLIDLSFNDGPTRQFTAYEPDQAGTGALFIEEYSKLLDAIDGSHWMRVDLPTVSGLRALRFEVGGLQRSKLHDAAAQ